MTEQQRAEDHPFPLAGVKVLEYGVFHAGPGATAILGDLGAEVIKVEAGIGDPVRYWTRVGGLDISQPGGESFMFEVSNRNKMGIYLDIKKEKGREAFHRLVENADVFLTNLRKSTKTKLGLDYDALSKVNPKIIHANVSGYGPDGPMSDLGAFDPLGLARSGLMFVTGDQEPRLIHLGVLDQTTAIAASQAIITALFVRERTGIGQEVHVSLYGTGLWMGYANFMLASGLSVNPTVSGDRFQHSPLRNCFVCRDGKWIIGTHHPEDKYWQNFCEATGQETLLDDPRFANDETRSANCADLVAIFDKVFATRTRDDWMEIFRPRGLMFSPVQHIREVEHDEQALANGYVVPFDHPTLGRFNIPGYPVHFSAAQAGTRRPAPGLGEHTDEVLSELCYSAQEIEDMRTEEVIK